MNDFLDDFNKNVERCYQNNFATLAGYLPQDRLDIDVWLQNIKTEAKNSDDRLKPSVEGFKELLLKDGIAMMYVSNMIEQVPNEYKTVHDVNELILALNYIVQRAPEYEAKSHFPMSALFVYMMYTPSGFGAFRYPPINEAIRAMLQEWCAFLDSKASTYVLNKENGWLSPKAYEELHLNEFVIPNPSEFDGGFSSYNAFFHRQIKLEYRPVQDKDDDKVIVSANDGTFYNSQFDVQHTDTFWIKSQPYSLSNMLDNSQYTDSFVKGSVIQTFLSGADYHRFRAPISGTVIEARVIDGLLFSELFVMGFDQDAGINSQGYDASVNTRGLVIIQSDNKSIGKVAIIPVGITEISSVTFNVKVGDKLQKGDELGWFSYGGSSLCLVFEPNVIKNFTANEQDNKVVVNQQIAQAN